MLGELAVFALGRLPVPDDWRGDLLFGFGVECVLRGWVPRALDDRIPGGPYSKKELRRLYRMERPLWSFPLCVMDRFVLQRVLRRRRCRIEIECAEAASAFSPLGALCADCFGEFRRMK